MEITFASWQAHPSTSKQERKNLCRLIDSRKLSPEASLHAAQNERLPVRAVIQVIFSEQSKLSRPMDWSGSFSGTRSPNPGLEAPTRCHSKREMMSQQMEIRKLKDDLLRLQCHCNSMQVQLERLLEKKKGVFKWKMFGMPSFKSMSMVETTEEGHEEEVGFGRQTPMDMKTKLVKRRNHPKWRKSMS